MAGFVSLWCRRDELLKDVYDAFRDAEQCRYLEFLAAVKIQSCYRGWTTRRRIANLHYHATVIQKWYRGHVGRRYYRNLVKIRLHEMRMNFYHDMATQIQKIWRGYYCRKYVHNYSAYKNYLKGIETTNKIVTDRLSFYQLQLNHKLAMERRRREEEILHEEARRTHYLLSTVVLPGVYNSPKKPQVEREERLRKSRPRSRDHLVFKEGGEPIHLPPLVPKVQGPFRSPDEVQRQQHKPLQPTLRVSTDFYCVEKARVAIQNAEWVARIQDKEFTPFSHIQQRYEPLLHTKSSYQRPAYGTLHFRETSSSNIKGRKRFATLVPSIPLFDQFNKTY
ncbi:spermatogenesis-associated protein 17-like [Corticium candelabrum]|uniref:spermatogenesis-associated protein 17-like n=1 Tax=Corticium candelabrum TaxID=121492 RepID=UPI002E254590|nr:spermatogenesis-associated protein 17-like [Corticium candelabrum]